MLRKGERGDDCTRVNGVLHSSDTVGSGTVKRWDDDLRETMVMKRRDARRQRAKSVKEEMGEEVI